MTSGLSVFEDRGVKHSNLKTGAPMSETPISPLRQRMLEDMSLRGFTPDTQGDYIRAVKKAGGLFGPVPRHRDCGRPARVPTAPDRERRSAANHQHDGDGVAVLLLVGPAACCRR